MNLFLELINKCKIHFSSRSCFGIDFAIISSGMVTTRLRSLVHSSTPLALLWNSSAGIVVLYTRKRAWCLYQARRGLRQRTGSTDQTVQRIIGLFINYGMLWREPSAPWSAHVRSATGGSSASVSVTRLISVPTSQVLQGLISGGEIRGRSMFL